MDHYDRLADLLSLPELTPEGADMPSKDSAARAAIVLEHLLQTGFPPDKIVASAEGGIALCWTKGDKYADVEVFNTGEVLCVITDRKNPPIVWAMEL